MPSKRGRGKKRQHVYRRPKDRPGAKFPGSHHCPVCGKWCYRSRDDAQDAVRQMHPGATVHYYLCDEWWHFTSMDAGQVGDIRARESVVTPDEPEEFAC